MEEELGLSQERMGELALLLGSDYTEVYPLFASDVIYYIFMCHTLLGSDTRRQALHTLLGSD